MTVPIRSDDRDYAKWYTFFENARKLHIIPIIRLATFVDGPTWVAPTVYDLVDFANFLNSLPWPTKNRYVILFNEPNHAAEWGGRVSPLEYSAMLLEAKAIFKDRSGDFFLLSAGLDMSAPQTATSGDALTFYRQMSRYHPDWSGAVDGLSVHAYPNPAFSASPYTTNRFGIRSFEYELSLLKAEGVSNKPLFITETGTKWDGGFYLPALTEIWTSSQIVAVTPFVLFAGAGDFLPFSLLDTARNPKANYRELHELGKTAGSPLLSPYFSSPPLSASASFPDNALPTSPRRTFLDTFKSILTPAKKPFLQINDLVVAVEISDTPAKVRQGLSGRASLPPLSGMLFVFPKIASQSFWMKDMKFPLDFVWIREGKVVELTQNVPPPSQTFGLPRVINPKETVNQVLEVPAGFIQEHGITVGDFAVLTIY